MLNDEFSHWGLAVKNLLTVGELPYGSHTNAIFRTYPPFATVVCFFGTSLSKTISEAGTFVPMDMCLLASFSPVASMFFAKIEEKTSKRKSILYLAPVFVAFVFSIMVFKLSAFTIIAVDTLMGAMASYIVVTIYLSEQERILPEVFFSIMTSVALAITKEAAGAFALFAGIIVILALIRRFLLKKKFVEFFVSGTSLVLFPILTNKLWNIILVSNGVELDERSIPGTLINMLKNGATDTQIEIAKAYLKAWILPKISIGVPLLVVFALLIGVSIIISIWAKKIIYNRVKEIVLINIVLPILFLVFEGGVLAGYFARFVENEARNVASFERYSGSFLTFWLIVLMGEVFLVLLPQLKEKVLSIANYAMVACSVAIIVFFGTLYPYTSKKSVAARNSYGGDPALYDKLLSEGYSFDDEIPIDSEGREFLVKNYDVAPFKLKSNK